MYFFRIPSSTIINYCICHIYCLGSPRLKLYNIIITFQKEKDTIRKVKRKENIWVKRKENVWMLSYRVIRLDCSFSLLLPINWWRPIVPPIDKNSIYNRQCHCLSKLISQHIWIRYHLRLIEIGVLPTACLILIAAMYHFPYFHEHMSFVMFQHTPSLFNKTPLYGSANPIWTLTIV